MKDNECPGDKGCSERCKAAFYRSGTVFFYTITAIIVFTAFVAYTEARPVWLGGFKDFNKIAEVLVDLKEVIKPVPGHMTDMKQTMVKMELHMGKMSGNLANVETHMDKMSGNLSNMEVYMGKMSYNLINIDNNVLGLNSSVYSMSHTVPRGMNKMNPMKMFPFMN